MLSSFPPFPSPNPAMVRTSPLDSAPIIPSPPSSSTSSSPSPSLSSSTSSRNRTDSATSNSQQRSRSRSAARKSVPSHTRIIRERNKSVSSASTSSTPISPPLTPASDTVSIPSTPITDSVESKSQISQEMEAERNSPPPSPKKTHCSSHHYEDAVRIACGAWADTGNKRKTVTWEKEIAH